MNEPKCWDCGEVLAEMVKDGVRRMVCPTCEPKMRAPRRIGRQTRGRGVVVIYRGRSGPHV